MFPSQLETSNSCKIEFINTISCTLYDDTPDITTITSLQSGKELDELVSKNDKN